MDRARSAQGSCEFGISGNSDVRLLIKMGQKCGNKHNHACGAPLLDRDEKLYGAIALLAFERTHVEARLGGLDTGKSHRLAAFGARENANIRNTK
jgi:hypothetical protein